MGCGGGGSPGVELPLEGLDLGVQDVGEDESLSALALAFSPRRLSVPLDHRGRLLRLCGPLIEAAVGAEAQHADVDVAAGRELAGLLLDGLFAGLEDLLHLHLGFFFVMFEKGKQISYQVREERVKRGLRERYVMSEKRKYNE